MGRSEFSILEKGLGGMSLNSTAGDAAAESFASVAEYDAYLLARGITNTEATGTKENNLRVGASYLVNQYRTRWVGIASTQTQALPWPRSDGYRTLLRAFTYPLLDVEGFQIDMANVPVQIKNANIEAALLAKGGTTLEPTLVRGGQIKSIGKTVGPLRKDITYMDGAPAVDRYTVIEGLLRGLVTSTPGSSSGNVRLVRS
jgi:hypothetical protein